MGRQVAAHLTDEDEVEFLSFLRQSADIQLFEPFAASQRELWVNTFGPRERHWTYHIWNQAFPWTPSLAQTRQDLPDPQRRGLFYISNKSDAPLLEYSRHSFKPDSPRAGIMRGAGRVYWAKYFSAPDGLAYDVEAFEKWYESVARWVRARTARSRRFSGSA